MPPPATIMQTATALMPNLAGGAVPTFGPSPTPTMEVTPTIPGVSGRPCPHRLTGDFLRVYVAQASVELALGCPTNRDEETPIQTWAVTVRYQPFERGAMLWLSNWGWEQEAVVLVLRDDDIYTRYPDRFDPSAATTPTPAPNPTALAQGTPPAPYEAPPGLFAPAGPLGYLWRTEPAVYEQLGFATQTAVVVNTEMLMLEHGELLRMPDLGLMYAFKRGNPGTWTAYALPGSG